MLSLLLIAACGLGDTHARSTLVAPSPERAAQVVEVFESLDTGATPRAEGVLVNVELARPRSEQALSDCQALVRAYLRACTSDVQALAQAEVEAASLALQAQEEGTEARQQALRALEAAQLAQALAQCEVRVLDDCRVQGR